MAAGAGHGVLCAHRWHARAVPPSMSPGKQVIHLTTLQVVGACIHASMFATLPIMLPSILFANTYNYPVPIVGKCPYMSPQK
jgi:hypothetical protein